MYNICIENPQSHEFSSIGELKIYVLSELNFHKNNIPEIYYDYKLINQNNRIEKVYLERRFIGAIKIEQFDNSQIQNLHKFYSIDIDGFFRIQSIKDSIIREIIFEAQEKEEIFIILSIDEEMIPDGLGYSVNLSKLNRGPSTQQQIHKSSKFISNRDDRFKLQLKTYKMKTSYQEELDINLFKLTLFSNLPNKIGSQRNWKAIKVYDTLLNKEEIEIISDKPIDNIAYHVLTS